jgi:uncharacterized protein (DUF697 family)
MAGINDWRNLLGLIGEMDIRPAREEAERFVEIGVISSDNEAALHLAEQLRRDPDRPEKQTNAPVYITTLEKFSKDESVNLILVMIDRAGLEALYQDETLHAWRSANRRAVIILQEKQALDAPAQQIVPTAGGKTVRIISGNVYQQDFLRRVLVPAVVALTPDLHLALARNYPLFRSEVARRLISDASTSNAAYSLTTGVAEIVPVLNIPLNLADMIILTKAQAFLVYRLGLALGMSVRWQSYLVEFGGVLGSGFLWRQLARMLVGFIPAYGILPKTAISYSGTYVVGQVVYQWYLTGRHIPATRIQSLYGQALENGKLFAANLFSRRFRLRKSTERKPKAKRLGRKKVSIELTDQAERVCAACGKTSKTDSRFCQYCGVPFESPAMPDTTADQTG